MNIKPIKAKADYRAALKDIESLMMAKANTPEGERLDVLVTLVEAYERKHYPLDLPDPVEAIKFVMEQRGLGVKDLVPLIGPANRVLRFFAGLTVEETARLVGRSPRTVKREWRLAKAWLYRELRPEHP